MMVKSFAIQIGCSSTRLTFAKFLFALCGNVVAFVQVLYVQVYKYVQVEVQGCICKFLLCKVQWLLIKVWIMYT